ncbi:GNAT family N-acetyltransferase [Haladaptatus sp. ZSTT2]|uniref:GNAT family N-acetyltransferase n=1 Tax=Haladaptatus sp. ZSTT2 TaxID=3120515 RepID=UPI00300ED117
MPGPVFLSGDTVSLHTVSRADLYFIQQHANDPAVWHSLAKAAPVNELQEEQWYESWSDGDDVRLLICADGESVGFISLSDFDTVHGSGTLGYWIAPDHWGNGYATEAVSLVCDYGFGHRRLHKLIAYVYDFNTGSQRVLEKLGFTKEGHLRDGGFIDHEYVDLLLYGILEDEWRAAQS